MLARGFLRSLGKSEMTQNVLVHEQVQLSFQEKVQIVFPRKNWEIPKVVENVTKLRLTHGRWLPPRGSKRRARPWKRPPTSSLNPLLLSNWGRISKYRNITFLRVQVFNGFIGISQYRNITFREVFKKKTSIKRSGWPLGSTPPRAPWFWPFFENHQSEVIFFRLLR